jgi:endonuclease/exonuclease/phosphatase family metal-dependent hydrolase
MKTIRNELPRIIEVGLLGLFFVQAVRFLYGTLYAHFGSIDQLTKTLNPALVGGQPGVIGLGDFQLEVLAVVIALLLPLVALVIHRPPFLTLAVAAAAAGRVYMTFSGRTTLGVVGAAIVLGAGGYAAAVLARRYGRLFPMLFVLGFGLDQLVRTYGASVDITWDGQFLPYQAGLSMLLFIAAVIAFWVDRETRLHPDYQPPPPTQIGPWGTVALGGLLYLEFAVFGLPNTVARRAGLDSIGVAPGLIAATLLPLVPAVREATRRFLVMFDAQWRGFVWLLMTGLLVIIGFRFSGPVAGAALIGAQFLIGLSLWWLVQPAEGSTVRANFSGAAITMAMLLFLALSGADYFTYDYAFVRGVQEPFETILRSMRGLGIAIVLIALLLVNLPAIIARKRLPYGGSRQAASALVLLLVIGAAGASFALSRPVLVEPPRDGQKIRIATVNIHGGYSLYFDENLKSIAAEIASSGADVVLLQEVETGRLVSFGTDQAAWLGQALGMQVDFFATNEAYQGLAVLARFPIDLRQVEYLTNAGKQTGVQFVRLRMISGSPFDVYNTQLSLLVRDSTRAPEAQQQDQLKQLDDIYSLIALNDPTLANQIVLGGTFNNTPGSDVYQKLALYFADPFANLAAEKAITWRLANNVTSRVDYLWLRNVTSLGSGVSELQATTHNMPVVEVSVR